MLETVIGIIGIGLLGVIGWIIDLGTRVSVVESQFEALPELLDSRLEVTNVKVDEANRRLDRIESKLNKER